MFGSVLVLGLLAPLGCGSDGPGAAGLGGRDSGFQEGPEPLAALALAIPLAEPARFETVVGVDHDPEVHEDAGALGRLTCTDYLGRAFPHCYDEHDGSDYILVGGFPAMDEGSSPVIAALDGVVVDARDGNYDRCHGDLSTGSVSCDGHDMIANSVTLAHDGADGRTWFTKYWHLKQDSVAVVEGDEVAAGTVLGLVGSSGYSSLPHLHFEVQVEEEPGAEPVTVDPYAGPHSQARSLWCDQGDEDELPGGC